MWEYNYSNTDELYHYGVLGMKWGVRKSHSRSSSDGKVSKHLSKQMKSKVQRFKKSKLEPDYKRMSDEELRRAVNRLNLEQQYKQLSGQSKSTDIGKRIVNRFKNKLIDDMTDIAYQGVKKVIQKQVTKMIEHPESDK